MMNIIYYNDWSCKTKGNSECENNKRRTLPKRETTFTLCPRLMSPKLIAKIRNTAAKRENDKKNNSNKK